MDWIALANRSHINRGLQPSALSEDTQSRAIDHLVCWGLLSFPGYRSSSAKTGMNWVVVVQSLSCVQLFATPWTAACQAPLSSTIPWSLLEFMFTESVMLSNHLILCHPFLLLVVGLKTQPSVIQWEKGLVSQRCEHQLALIQTLGSAGCGACLAPRPGNASTWLAKSLRIKSTWLQLSPPSLVQLPLLLWETRCAPQGAMGRHRES